MTLVNAQDFIMQLAGSDGYRTLYLEGTYGTGKTLASVAIAYELWKQSIVKEICSNFPLHGVSRSDSATDFVMILDETSRILDSRNFGKNEVGTWLNDLRKRNVVVLMPSKTEIDKRLRVFKAYRYIAFGTLLWVYKYFKYKPDTDRDEKLGMFFILKPSKYFDAYPTEFQPSKKDFQYATDKMAIGSDFAYLDNEAAWEEVTGVQTVPVIQKPSKLSKLRGLRSKEQPASHQKTLEGVHIPS